MRSKTNGDTRRIQMTDRVMRDGPNWILIAGGALLTSLSIRIGFKLKQALETKGLNKTIRGVNNTSKQSLGACQFHSNVCQFTSDKDICYLCISGHATCGVQFNQVSDTSISKESELSLPLVKISSAEHNQYSNGNTVRPCSPELLELLQKPFHHSTGSDSPSNSESGSDIYTKREVINKLRQQLKRRDEMIMAMQNQIADLQNSLCIQTSQVTKTQSQLDLANHDLFESEREIQRLRKVIANHCILMANSSEKSTSVETMRPQAVNDFHGARLQKVDGDEERVVLLKKELGELIEVIEGKDFILQSCKEEKIELCSMIKALEQRLESRQLNIF